MGETNYSQSLGVPSPCLTRFLKGHDRLTNILRWEAVPLHTFFNLNPHKSIRPLSQSLWASLAMSCLSDIHSS